MSNEDLVIYKKIQLMQEYILAECEAYIYNPQDQYYEIFLRIKHIVDNLCKNALSQLKHNKTLFKGSAQNLSIQQTALLLQQIYNHCSLPSTPVEKNLALNDILQDANLYDVDILILTPR